MPTEMNLILTSKVLFDALQNYYEGRHDDVSASPAFMGVAGLSFHLMDDPGDGLPALITAWKDGREDRDKPFVFIDSDYDRVKMAADNGWRTVWVNREGAIAPDAIPMQDVDLYRLDRLVDLPDLLRKPSLSQCLAWWEEWGLPDNIRQHARMVAWLAYVLGVMLRNRGIIVDPILAQRGGLLHDLDKIKTLDKSMGHGEMAAEFLKSEGYPETAEIVRGHIMNTILHSNADDRRWETKLVFFVDKLVEGDRLVPFDERLRALKARYPDYREVMARAEAGVWALNDEICSILSIPDHEILISTLLKH